VIEFQINNDLKQYLTLKYLMIDSMKFQILKVNL